MLSHKKIIVFYHKNCPDGFGAAWATWKKFGTKADYIALGYEDPVSFKDVKNKTIYLVDFSFSPKNIEDLKKRGNEVIMIDHHISAQESFKVSSGGIYDMKHSGAVLTWIYFFPEKKVPLLLKYIEDQDLWNFKLPDTEKIIINTKLDNFDFKFWNKLERDFENKKKINQFKKEGEILLSYRDKMIDNLVDKKTYFVKFEGIKAPVINFSFRPATSSLAHILYTKYPPMAIIWHEVGNLRKFSLRSNGKVDVSKIAKKFGGGGHKKASGFDMPIEKPFPWKIIKK